MLSKAQNKYIRSLTQQKFRQEHKVFLAEGAKIAEEWLNSSERIQIIAATEPWMAQNTTMIARHQEAEVHTVTESELASLSDLRTPNQVLLAVHLHDAKPVPQMTDWCIALDGLQDPGNMGSIIRIADWFGIKHLVCGAGCVDVYNPKVVQAAMGGHLRVNLYEADLAQFLAKCTIPVIAATLDGSNIYSVNVPPAGVLVIGNESKGISAPIQALATQKVMIPRKGGAESLNAAVSAGILCALMLPS